MGREGLWREGGWGCRGGFQRVGKEEGEERTGGAGLEAAAARLVYPGLCSVHGSRRAQSLLGSVHSDCEDLALPWLRPFSGRSGSPGHQSPHPQGWRLPQKHLGPAASQSHFRFKKVAQAAALITETETLPGLPRGGAAGSLQPGSLLSHLHGLRPVGGAAAVPRPPWSWLSTAGSENSGPLVLSSMFS